ncbi:MAG TPA: flavodoxin domain-containing protein [Anaerolineaceae bacterium]|nr:flavodoxin domain-containing protein [Anaerolineaceae bacterium]
MTQPVSRRSFLKKSCLIAGAAGLAVCGGGALAATYQPKIEKPTVSLGDDAGKRVLVAYATRAGSTAQTAVRMGELLAKRGLRVDVQPVAGVTDLAPYSAVVAGSGIRSGAVLPELLTFLQNNQAALQQKPLGLFILCMTLASDTEANRKTVSAYLDPVRAVVKPASEGLFAGVMDMGKLILLERLAIMAMAAPSGDFRNWDQINAWTEKTV